MPDAETRQAPREIRDMMATRFTQVEINTQKLARLEAALTQHIETCDANKAILTDVKDLMEGIRDGQRFANIFRRIVLWMAPFIAISVSVLGYFKKD